MAGGLLDPEDLAALVRVVDAGTVTRAAAQMYISQPAVTQRLRRLERVLGARLVERRGRGLSLTDTGRAVLPLARNVLHLLEQIPAAVSDVQGLKRGDVLLGASATIGESVLPRRLSAFAVAYPHITVRLHIENTQGIVSRVLDHTLHAGVVGLRPASTSLVALPFLDDEVVLVAAPSHPLAGRRVTAEQLSGTRILLREVGSATRAIALEALARCGVDTDTAVGFGSNGAVRAAVLAGYGVAALSSVIVADELELRRIKPVRLQGWRCRRRFYVIRRRDRGLSRAEETLLEFLRRGSEGRGASAGVTGQQRR